MVTISKRLLKHSRLLKISLVFSFLYSYGFVLASDETAAKMQHDSTKQFESIPIDSSHCINNFFFIDKINEENVDELINYIAHFPDWLNAKRQEELFFSIIPRLDEQEPLEVRNLTETSKFSIEFTAFDPNTIGLIFSIYRANVTDEGVKINGIKMALNRLFGCRSAGNHIIFEFKNYISELYDIIPKNRSKASHTPIFKRLDSIPKIPSDSSLGETPSPSQEDLVRNYENLLNLAFLNKYTSNNDEALIQIFNLLYDAENITFRSYLIEHDYFDKIEAHLIFLKESSFTNTAKYKYTLWLSWFKHLSNI